MFLLHFLYLTLNILFENNHNFNQFVLDTIF